MEQNHRPNRRHKQYIQKVVSGRKKNGTEFINVKQIGFVRNDKFDALKSSRAFKTQPNAIAQTQTE